MPDTRIEYQTIQARPLTPTIGAEIFGVDMSLPLTARVRAEILSARHAALG